jgi:amino acid adenylation domain-containing protein
LNRKANQLAHYLQQQGVGPGMLVGLCVERSLEMVVGLLGILKAGGAYVPMDPTYPVERLAFMLEDTQAPVLVTQQSLMAGQSEHKALVICMDGDWNAIARMSEENMVSRVTADNLVYVIYTSGSTGRPKGVAVEHRQLLNYLNGILQRLELPAGSSFATVSTLATDLGNTAIFPSLCTGGCLHVLSRERTTDAHALVDYFQSHPIDCLKITPSHLAALQALSQTKPIMPLRRLIIGGESSSCEWVNKLQALAPDCTIFNHYGPTETTVGVLTYRVKREQEQDKRSYTVTPLGRPIANTQIYLLDQYRCPVPIGVPGEVYIGGASVARGYLNRPELTAEKFIPDPFSAKSGSRLYKTGDLARYLSDGNIEFLGRIDDQIKLRGFRIELGEIEEVLRQHPDVRSAAVIVREETLDNKYLVAYVVVDQQQSSTLSSIQSSLKEKLPTYMIPSCFVMLDALPLTPSGKIDRRALPAPDTSSRIVEEIFVAPTLTEHYQLIQIWEELLDARPIGIRDNFFLLGGHSLVAARLVARIQEVFGKKISLATLFASPTIEQLAKALQQHEEIAPPSPIIVVQHGGTRRPFFFLHGDYKGGAFYCFPLAHELGADQPFYAVEPYKFHDVTALPTLETIAATHIEKLRSIQPEGPYMLGGFCNGGLFTYEMARQLQAQGQAVDLLVLMEPTPVAENKLLRRTVNFIGNLLHRDQGTQVYWFLWLRHMYKYLLHLYRYVCYPHYRPLETELKPEQIKAEGTIVAALKALYEQKVGLGIERLGTGEQMEPERRRGQARFTLPKLHSVFPDALFPPAKALHRDWGGIFHWVASVYVPGFYHGKSTFFVFQDNQEWYPHRKPWRKLASMKDKETEMHMLPGTHDSCKTTYLSKMGECLRKCLDSVM